MSNFDFSWYDRHDNEFQVNCSVSKGRAATLEEPREYPEVEVLSVQPVVGIHLGADILGLMDEKYIEAIELAAEEYERD